MTQAALKILLLDDDEDEFVILKRVLARARGAYSLDWTADVDQAMADARRGGHDLYLVDYRLGSVTGVDVIRGSIEAGAKAPMILLTGTAPAQQDGGVDLEALRVGAADYLDKQELTPERLDRAIRYALERAEAVRLREEGSRLQQALAQVERAAERTSRLQATTAALAQMLTPGQVGEAVIEHGLAALGTASGVVYMTTRDGRRLQHMAGRSSAMSHLVRYETLPLSFPAPLATAVREQRALFFQTRRQLLEEFPGLVELGLAPEIEAMASLPLLVSGRALGGISLFFSEPRSFSAEDREFALAIAQQCAQAVDRSLLAQSERRAREGASFLAEASALLASSLDYETVLQNLTRLVVPKLADWCSVEMMEGDGMKHLAIAHTDPEKVHWARELRQQYPPERDRPRGLWQVIRTGKPELYPEISDELLKQTAADPAQLRMMRQVGMKSALIVPLVAGGKPLGGMTLVWAESGHSYEQGDLDFMMEVAHRAALAVENARLYRDLQAAVQARDDFLAIAGHELKTPLAALLLHIQGVERLVRGDAGIPSKLKQRLEKAVGTGKRLEKLIVEMLDVSRVTAGRLNLEPGPFPLDELVREAVERFGEQSARTGTPLILHLEPGVRGVWDRLRIDQVVTNLVSNALKYGRGKPVEVLVQRRDGQAVLRVADQGIGIPLDQQRKIFERFERAVATREYGGFGLGLWIARKIVEASGGNIEVYSAPDHGATFTVTLPLQEETHASP